MKINQQQTNNLLPHRLFHQSYKLIFSTLLIILLQACGGSGDNNSINQNSTANNSNTNSTNNTNQPLNQPVNNSIVDIDRAYKINQSIELILYYPNDELSQIKWQQTSGSAVIFLAENSKVISFTPTQAGDYAFEVTFSVNGGALQSLPHVVTVTNENTFLSARLGHAVKEENNVSLSIQFNDRIMTNSLQWQQLSGPTTNITTNPETYAIFFDAPNVTQDTILTFEVTGETATETHQDVISIIVENSQPIENNAYFDERIAAVFPYDNQSPYAENLVACVYSNQLSSSCTLGTLPLIAQDTATPTVDDIMQRVVVSHQWMGDRFKAFLQNHDVHNDFKNLLRATTAIVISYDIRPSFYWAATGAIYLDADNFWLTPDERDTINQAPDYRSNYGNELQFVVPWRYIKNNDYAESFIPESERITRTSEEALTQLASLLYHELSHANDFFPQSEWLSHNDNERILDAALKTSSESEILSLTYPLLGDELYNLAKVSFLGEAANTTQTSYLPTDVAQLFSQEQANSYYSYSSEREDYAMLFEELMMQVRYSVLRDVAITNNPSGSFISASDYIVEWGQRGRIGESQIKTRAAFVANRVLPEFDSTTAINNLAAPIEMIKADNWIENLTLSPLSSPINTKSTANKTSASQSQSIKKRTPYYHKDLPN